MCARGRRQGAQHKTTILQNRIAPNGRRPATLPEPIKRARDKDLCGFAGEGNVVERSERYASVAKPEEPQDKKRRARAVLVRCCCRLLENQWIFVSKTTKSQFSKADFNIKQRIKHCMRLSFRFIYAKQNT
jgi:hypothetical protein